MDQHRELSLGLGIIEGGIQQLVVAGRGDAQALTDRGFTCAQWSRGVNAGLVGEDRAGEVEHGSSVAGGCDSFGAWGKTWGSGRT